MNTRQTPIGRFAAHHDYHGAPQIDVDAVRAEALDEIRQRQARTLRGAWLRWRPRLAMGLFGYFLVDGITSLDWINRFDPRHTTFWERMGTAAVLMCVEALMSRKRANEDPTDQRVAHFEKNLRLFTGPGWPLRTIGDALQFGILVGLAITGLVVMGAAERGYSMEQCARVGIIAELCTIAAAVPFTFWTRASGLKNMEKYFKKW